MCADFSDLFYTRTHTDAHTDAHGCKHMHSLTWMVGWSDGWMWSPGALSTSSGPVATSTTTGAGRKSPLATKNQCPLDAVALCFLLTAALLMTSSHSEGSVIGNLQTVVKHQPWDNASLVRTGPGCWSYPDMLEVGNLAGNYLPSHAGPPTQVFARQQSF